MLSPFDFENWYFRLFELVKDYVSKLSSDEASTVQFGNFSVEMPSGVFFAVPKQEMVSNTYPIPNPNELLLVFTIFLLQIAKEILHLKSEFVLPNSFRNLMEVLKMELEFLLTFLGDTPMHFQSTEMKESKILVKNIEDVVNEVGSFLYWNFVNFQTPQVGMDELGNLMMDTPRDVLITEGGYLDYYFHARNDLVRPDQALHDLLEMFEELKTKIEDHVKGFSKKPIGIAPRSAVASLFILDSVIDEELVLLQYSVTEKAAQQPADHEELLIRASDVAYEIEYVINSFPPVWYLNLRLPQLTEKIKLIRMEAKEIKNDINARGKPVVISPTNFVLEDVFVGFENETNKILTQLVRGGDQRQIISIVGMPGLGKTTLAKKLYQDPYVVNHFDRRAWCVISQTYNKKNILIDILRSTSDLKKESLMEQDEETLAQNVYKSLKGIRYLIVIDDIWDIEPWDNLRRYFPDDRIGSRILFTTRNREVGSKASPQTIENELPFLSPNESWELLHQKIFEKEHCPKELVNIGLQIAKSCNGLPLAVVVIAAVLANMEKKEHLWRNIATNLNLHISKNPEKCIYILELSYRHLPAHLKPCFLYIGALGEDVEIGVNLLISLWIGEGFIKRENENSAEDVAKQYLMELINRSLVLVGEQRSDGDIKTCKIHDLLREMCSRIMERENFLKVIEDELPLFVPHHRLLIDSNNKSSMPLGLHFRSLFLHTCQPFVLSGLKILRVLACQNLEEFEDRIEHLFQLRYLIVGSMSVLQTIKNFNKLEFLLVGNREYVEMPDFLLHKMSLRHVDFQGGAYFSQSCRKKESKDGIFGVNNIENISLVIISDETDVEVLRCSPKLRRLVGRTECASYPSFDFLDQLESLKLSVNYYKVKNIRSSSLMNLPLNLKKLTLMDFHLSWEQMRIIGSLPNLVVFKLRKAAFEGEKWDVGEGKFPQLKFLKLIRVKIIEWNVSTEDFPAVERLVLVNCQQLKVIPSSFGEILKLQIIEVYRCTQAIEQSAIQIQEAQQDMGNDEFKVIISQ